MASHDRGQGMAFFYSFTDALKGKWLQFFQINRDWIRLHIEIESVYTPDGGKRPPSYLILGVVNALEPKLAQLMLPFSKLNTDADILVEVLGLNFDPDVALGNRIQTSSNMDEDSENSMSGGVSEYVIGRISYTGESSQNVMANNSGLKDAILSESSEEEISTISLSNLQDFQIANLTAGIPEENIGGNMFDNISSSANDENLMRRDDNLIRDVWTRETNTQNGEKSYQVGEGISINRINNMETA